MRCNRKFFRLIRMELQHSKRNGTTVCVHVQQWQQADRSPFRSVSGTPSQHCQIESGHSQRKEIRGFWGREGFRIFENIFWLIKTLIGWFQLPISVKRRVLTRKNWLEGKYLKLCVMILLDSSYNFQRFRAHRGNLLLLYKWPVTPNSGADEACHTVSQYCALSMTEKVLSQSWRQKFVLAECPNRWNLAFWLPLGNIFYKVFSRNNSCRNDQKR